MRSEGDGGSDDVGGGEGEGEADQSMVEPEGQSSVEEVTTDQKAEEDHDPTTPKTPEQEEKGERRTSADRTPT